jgi:serine/threonine protein phosphatase PrpC
VKFTIFQESRTGKRRNNQDRLAYCYSRDALLLVLADGMGGHLHGERLPQESWTCKVFLGESNLDKGKYEIAVVVVNDEVHRELSGWVQTAKKTGQYPTIDFPVSFKHNYQEIIKIDKQ